MHFPDDDPVIRAWVHMMLVLGARSEFWVLVVCVCDCTPYGPYIRCVLCLYPQLEFTLAEVSSVSLSRTTFSRFLRMYSSSHVCICFLGRYYTHELKFTLAEFFLHLRLFLRSMCLPVGVPVSLHVDIHVA
jgi:hypothetical protein